MLIGYSLDVSFLVQFSRACMHCVLKQILWTMFVIGMLLKAYVKGPYVEMISFFRFLSLVSLLQSDVNVRECWSLLLKN